MTRLADLVFKVRSKNAGPFWVTLDVFCGSAEVFETVRRQVSAANVAALFQVKANGIKRFEIASLNVVKFSIPRPVVQGDRYDRDMHGAQWAVLLGDLRITISPPAQPAAAPHRS